MVTCCAVGCTNSSNKGKYKLYRLPVGKRNDHRLKLWLLAIRRDRWKPNEHCRLCEVHFADDQFERNRADNRRLLKPNAVPSIFNHPPVLKPEAPRKDIHHESKGQVVKPKLVKSKKETVKAMPSLRERSVLRRKQDILAREQRLEIRRMEKAIQKRRERAEFLKKFKLLEKQEKEQDAPRSEPHLFLELQRKIQTSKRSNQRKMQASPSNSIAKLNVKTIFMSRIKPPDFSTPGPSNRVDPNFPTADQIVQRGMTCEVFPAHVTNPDFLSIKKEPIDPDMCEQNIHYTNDVQNQRHISSEASVSSNQNGSLFQPPVIIKEEPVSFEEDL